MIKRINKSDKKTLADLNLLLLQWSSNNYQVKSAHFKALIKKSHIVGMYDGKKMIGTVTLIPLYKISGLKGSIEHVLIDEKYRGQGLGKKLIQAVILMAKKMKMKALFLTCEPHRQAANALYKKMGFIAQNTQFYELKL